MLILFKGTSPPETGVDAIRVKGVSRYQERIPISKVNPMKNDSEENIPSTNHHSPELDRQGRDRDSVAIRAHYTDTMYDKNKHYVSEYHTEFTKQHLEKNKNLHIGHFAGPEEVKQVSYTLEGTLRFADSDHCDQCDHC